MGDRRAALAAFVACASGVAQAAWQYGVATGFFYDDNEWRSPIS